MSKNKEPELQSNSFNKISYGTEIVGSINAASDFRIDGYVEGNITCKGKVVVGEKAHVKGDIVSSNIDVEGKVEGTITVSELLSLKRTAVVIGDIMTQKLTVEVGAEFNGTCRMSDSIAPAPLAFTSEN